MNILHQDIKPEQKISPRTIILILLAINTLFIYWIEGSGLSWRVTDQGFTFFLVVFGVACVALAIEWVHTLAGRWAIYIGLTAIVLFAALWWGMPEFLILVAMPIGLLAAMLNIQSAAAACVLLSALLLGFHQALLPGIPAPVINLSVFACWVMLATLFSIFLPYENIISWTHEQLEQAYQFLAEARGRKAELEHTLESLANANRQLALANKKMAELWNILLPLCGPALATVAVFAFIGNWNNFLGPLIYLRDTNLYTLAIGLQRFQGTHGNVQYHYMMAVSTLIVLPIILVFFLAQRLFVKGIVMTGMKG